MPTTAGTNLTREQITEWLRLAEAATPGPWEWDDDKHEAIYGPMDFEERWAVIDIGFVPGNPEPNLFLRDNDADFILAARAAVPALCRALLDAMEELEASATINQYMTGQRDRLAAENAALRSDLETLHKRIRGLAVDCGADQTDDAVEDVRRGVAALREQNEILVATGELLGKRLDEARQKVTYYEGALCCDIRAQLVGGAVVKAIDPEKVTEVMVERDSLREKLAAAEAAMQWRPEVARLASAMEARLRANDHKGGWQEMPVGWLFQRLRDEVSELYEAIGTLKPELVWHEAADVADFAMMIADVVERQCAERRPPAPGGERE